MDFDPGKILFSYKDKDFRQRLGRLREVLIDAAAFAGDDPRAEQLRHIVNEVAKRGDDALAEFTEKFDGVKLEAGQFQVPAQDLEKAHKQIDGKLVDSIRKSIANVRRYQEEIFIGRTSHPGVRYTPLRRVGVCVPGASAPLPSTVIMTAVCAQAAGVEQIVVISPPRYQGSIHPVILAVCRELGLEEVYRLGGAQAVAALAFGTETIEKVDKIVGPGNVWVQMAKKEVYGRVDVDSIAGASEVLIVADGNARADWVAADMLSQAEHDPGSAVVFTDSQELAQAVVASLAKQVAALERSEGTGRCLAEYSGIAVFESFDDVIEAANYFASEHLQVQCGDRSRAVAERIRNAGAIFVGDHTPVAVGDYWAGPSHTLPTGGTAKFFSPLSSNDFVKSTSIIEYSSEQLRTAASDIIHLAETEGLGAHAQSVRVRQEKN